MLVDGPRRDCGKLLEECRRYLPPGYWLEVRQVEILRLVVFCMIFPVNFIKFVGMSFCVKRIYWKQVRVWGVMFVKDE
jgi:hypothetical protein